MSVRDFHESRDLARALRSPELTPGFKSTSRRQILEGGHTALDGLERAPAIGLEIGDGTEESARIRVGR